MFENSTIYHTVYLQCSGFKTEAITFMEQSFENYDTYAGARAKVCVTIKFLMIKVALNYVCSFSILLYFAAHSPSHQTVKVHQKPFVIQA